MAGSNLKVFMAMLAACLLLALFVGVSAVRNQEPHYKDGDHNPAHHKDDDSLEPADLINKLIEEHDVVIFSKRCVIPTATSFPPPN
jgi:hypothetical protein